MSETSTGVPADVTDSLLDPGYVVTAAPEHALALFERSNDPRVRAIAAVYRASSDVHRTLGAAQRRQVLALDAARLGAPELAASFGAVELPGEPLAQWTAEWAGGSLPDHRLLRSLTGHGGPVRAVATAVVDGRPVAVSGSRDNTVRVWDVATGVQLHDPVTGRTDPVSSMTAEVLSVATAVADRRTVAFTLHADGSVLVWDLATGRAAGEFVGLVESTALDGRRVVLTHGADGTLRVGDLLTGRQVSAFRSATDIAVLDGRRVVVTVDSTDVDRTVRVWDLSTGRQLAVSLEVVRTVVLDGRLFAVTLQVGQDVPGPWWDLATGEPVGTSSADPIPYDAEDVPGVSTVTVVDGRVVAIGLDDEEPRFVGALAHARRISALEGGRDTAVLDGRTVALTVDEDATLRIWDLTADHPRVDGMRVIRSIGPNGQEPAPSPGAAKDADLWHRISGRRNERSGSGSGSTVRDGTDDAPAVLTLEEDGTVVVRDPATGLPWDPPLTGHTGRVWDVATTVVDGRPVAVTAGADHTLRTWDLTDALTSGGPRTGHTGSAVAMDTAVLDGRAVAVTACADHVLRLWDLATGQLVSAPVTGPDGEVTALATSVVDGRVVAVAAGPGATLHVLDLAGERHPAEPVLGHQGKVLGVAAATVGGQPLAVTAGTDRTVALWNLATHQQVGEPLTGHSSRVTSVATAVLEGRPVAVTGSWDKTVRLWDLTTGRQTGEPLTGHTDWVTSVATAVLEGKPVAISRSRDRTVRLWDLTTMRQVGGATCDTDPNGTMAVTVRDGRPVVATAQGRSVQFVDLVTGRAVEDAYLFPLPVGALAAAPGGRLVVAFGPEVAVLRPTPRRVEQH
ncbi:hypothetical protein ABZZ20_21315 [Streptomyces sp. NPDC006430]|uniref:WD40 repeat domain-containing protein n=1 Tax=Streptomyces sp. NPDC006430 TaxID=3154299 RepID=UPI0033A4DD88